TFEFEIAKNSILDLLSAKFKDVLKKIEEIKEPIEALVKEKISELLNKVDDLKKTLTDFLHTQIQSIYKTVNDYLVEIRGLLDGALKRLLDQITTISDKVLEM